MKTLEELHEIIPACETDDWRAATMMVQDTMHCQPELRIVYLARWAARLRERYVSIGADAALADYGAEKTD